MPPRNTTTRKTDSGQGVQVAAGSGAHKPRNLRGTTENSARRRREEAHPRNHRKAHPNLVLPAFVSAIPSSKLIVSVLSGSG